MVFVVTARNVCKTFGSSDTYLDKQLFHASPSDRILRIPAVDHASFNVYKGELFGIVGQGRSGKSTLLRLIAGQLLPDKGEMQVFGYDVVKQPVEVSGLLSMVPFEASYFRKLSPVENILYMDRLYGMSGIDIRGRVEEILLCLGFTRPAMYKVTGDISPVIRQKIAIGRAMLSSPQLLLMDEPSRGLDQCSKTKVRQVIKKLNRETGITILLATRDEAEADDLCDRKIVIECGKNVSLDKREGEITLSSTIGNEPAEESCFIDTMGKTLVRERIKYQRIE